MKSVFAVGDKKQFVQTVAPEDVARFESGTVHNVYATFALTRDAEWSSRLFVLAMKEEDEEGIGTYVHVHHHSPALVGEQVVFEAVLEELNGNTVNCTFIAKVNERIIATGRTGQKILKKEKIEKMFNELSGGNP
ncbi:MAG: hypothetical protein JNK66_09555 [Chitinophagales bacterium]|nr:hypothetical protein [Chitinophagales bacterium]